MPITTGKGDGGETDYRGGRRAKDDPGLCALGDLDELQSFLAEARHYVKADTASRLERSVSEVSAIMGELAWPGESTRLNSDLVTWLDDAIRDLERAHPMRGFCLPGRSPASAKLDVCRAVCRRAERGLVSFARRETLNPIILIYVNRLSDYLYLAARDNE